MFESMITSVVEQLSQSVIILLWLMLIDQLTGIWKAIYLRRLDSSVGIRGLMRKVGCLIFIVAAHIFQPLLPGTPTLDVWLTIAFSFFEMLSIAENVAWAGVPLPPQMLAIMRAFETVAPAHKITKSTTEVKSDDPTVPVVVSKTIAVETITPPGKTTNGL